MKVCLLGSIDLLIAASFCRHSDSILPPDFMIFFLVNNNVIFYLVCFFPACDGLEM